MKLNELYFDVCDNDSDNPEDHYIILIPISFWEKHHHSTDEHFGDSLEGLPENWYEDAESLFVVKNSDDEYLNANELREEALKLGMKPLPEVED